MQVPQADALSDLITLEQALTGGGLQLKADAVAALELGLYIAQNFIPDPAPVPAPASSPAPRPVLATDELRAHLATLRGGMLPGRSLSVGALPWSSILTTLMALLQAWLASHGK